MFLDLKSFASSVLTNIGQIQCKIFLFNIEKNSGVIFVIDSTSIRATLKDTAEYLFDLLTDATLARSRTPFLILCNKKDLTNAQDTGSVEEMLQTEL